ncbi:MAG: Wzz/FepE/Etk N-terminal domain-containing protein [Paracoccaceae bacterium]
MGQIQTIEDLLNFVKRRLWLILGLTVLGVLLSALYAKTRADTYEASAVIEVQSAQIGSDAGSTGRGSAQLLQSIEQRLTTRENLMAVIQRHGLYAGITGKSPDELSALLRRNVTFQSIAAAGNSPYASATQISAIIITASDGDPALAARVANDFAQGVLDMSSSGAQDRARDAVAFYREEEASLSAQIASVEAEIASYKIDHAAALPGVTASQRDELTSLETEMRGLDQGLVALMEEQRQLLAKGQLRATEQRRLQDLDGQIAVLTEQKSALSARRAELSTALADLPEAERALAGYQRQLDQLQSSLDGVIAKLTEAETGAKLAERQQGERFALLDRALTPDYPVGSGGKKLFLAGAIASLLGALGLALVLDLAKPVVRTSAQLERQLGLRPIVTIPEISLPDQPSRKLPGGGSGAVDVAKKLMALPRVVLVCTGLTAVLVVTAALG